MLRTLIGIIVSLAFVGGGCFPREKSAITVGDVPISLQEFEAAFNTSPYIYAGEEGREAFLENYITKKLILLEAERMDLDKDPAFLSDIQIFWEQGLLKRVLTEKNKVFAAQVSISDTEVEAFYNHQPTTFGDKPLDQVRDQIRGILEKEKRSALIQQWIDALRARSKIRIDYQRLGIKEPQGGQL